MIANADNGERNPGLVVVDIGNSAIHVGIWSDTRVSDVQRIEHGDAAGLDQALGAHSTNIQNLDPVAAIIASVLPAALPVVTEAIARVTLLKTLVVGRDIDLPLACAVRNRGSVGVDR